MMSHTHACSKSIYRLTHSTLVQNDDKNKNNTFHIHTMGKGTGKAKRRKRKFNPYQQPVNSGRDTAPNWRIHAKMALLVTGPEIDPAHSTQDYPLTTQLVTSWLAQRGIRPLQQLKAKWNYSLPKLHRTKQHDRILTPENYWQTVHNGTSLIKHAYKTIPSALDSNWATTPRETRVLLNNWQQPNHCSTQYMY
jgi:hypothetical protein